ncbi:transglutaminase domain-containing protein [Aquabacterium sp. A7-Y]|uniref:transglutaminase-like domain-containing protein n=1 Tax=Aquabacterium sp. A7-Y TaxID=1349605 RepID=UPI00223D32D9|nr:transglutaminase domain-containing protein [Aquabacterium sp. A7-Y]MCW7538221.1 transglutaminase domain-containing protein [Aquabacterium sp. A7-Y]
MNAFSRRTLLKAAGLGAAATAFARVAQAHAPERRFEPAPGRWRSFEVTTRVELLAPKGATRVWLPVPSIDSDYQRSVGNDWSGNARSVQLVSDRKYGARLLHAEFDAATATPVLQLTSRVQTRDRRTDWERAGRVVEDRAVLRAWTEATDLMPTDGIVLRTASEITQGARGDLDKVRRIFDWVVHTTYREPTVRGCGVGDIESMLETGNFGGKCGDINALFVGLCRAVGVPARDVYGLRLAPSAFGYRELSGNPASLKGAQHCRAEVFLKQYGWVAMDPADVGKVMRLETGEWIKDTSHPVVAPVNRALFGGWEGNWLGYNMAHDVRLPGSEGPALGFLMYPQAENADGRYDPLDPDRFKYTITAREI